MKLAQKNIKLRWNIDESIPVHNNIKLRHQNWRNLLIITKTRYSTLPKIRYKLFVIILCQFYWRTQFDYRLPTDGLDLRFDYLHIVIGAIHSKSKKFRREIFIKTNKLAEMLYKRMKLEISKEYEFINYGWIA